MLPKRFEFALPANFGSAPRFVSGAPSSSTITMRREVSAETAWWDWVRATVNAAPEGVRCVPMTDAELARVRDLRQRAARLHDGVELTDEEVDFLRGLVVAGKATVTRAPDEAADDDTIQVVSLASEPWRTPPPEK